MYISRKVIERMTEKAKKIKGNIPTATTANLEVLTELRIHESIYSAALRGHNNVSLNFYQKYYYNKDLYKIIEGICRNSIKDFNWHIETKTTIRNETYYKLTIKW